MELSRLLSQVPDDDVSLSPASQALRQDVTLAFDLSQPQFPARRNLGICSWQWASTTAARVFHLRSARHLTVHCRYSKIHKSYCGRFATYLLRAIAIFIIVSAFNAILNPSYANPPPRYKFLEQQVTSSAASGRGNVNREKIFIAANIINEELIRGSWGSSVLDLVDILGEENVFISIYENDSGTGTRDALRSFQCKLPCSYTRNACFLHVFYRLTDFKAIHPSSRGPTCL